MIQSRLFRTGIFSLISLLATFSFCNIAQASAAMQKSSAPGYYRFMLGEFEITALSDGTVKLAVEKLLTNIKPESLSKALHQHHLGSPLETSVNAYLINTGSKLVLIDSGAGQLFGPTLGKLAAHITAAGYQAAQVDEIYITHMHADHFGGLTSAGQALFPNAIVRADQHDVDYWLHPANLEQAPADKKATYERVMASFKPYMQAGHFQPFEGNTELAPGISAIASHGHTPGHSIYQIESKGEKLMLWGDLMHVAAVQFEQPGVTITFDSDSKAAAKQRQKAYAEAASQTYLVGAAHLSFPGLGYLRKQGNGYVWMPLNYTALP